MASLGDLLCGYNSGASSDSEGEAPAPEVAVASTSDVLAGTPSKTATQLSSDAATGVASKLPQPRAGKRVPFQLPLRAALLAKAADSDEDDDDQPKKKLKFSGQKTSILDVLPPPKNVRPTLVADTNKHAQQPLAQHATQPASANGNAPGNEAFRVDLPAEPRSAPAAHPHMAHAGAAQQPYYGDLPARVAASDGAQPSASAAVDHSVAYDANTAYDYSSYAADASAEYGAAHAMYGVHAAAYSDHAGYYDGGDSTQHAQQPSSVPASGRQAAATHNNSSSSSYTAEDAFLEAALAAERAKARRQGRDDIAAAIQLTEVRADDLKHMDPSAQASADELRNALGSEYAATLRSQAGPMPTKMAKRKHQIHSLYWHAKTKELEMLETRAQGLKSKAETEAKYGWR